MSPIAARPPAVRAAATLLATLLAALTLLATAGSAEAASYRYWGFYTWTNGTWTFATKGPDQTKPADGAVEGWRFAVSAESGSPRTPRANGDFDAICASTKAATGKKRVAVVIDAGLPADAPAGEKPPAARGACALVDATASSAQVLSAVAKTRVEKELVCGIDGYPSTGCGDQTDATPPATPDAQVRLALPAAAADKPSSGDDGSGPPWAGIAVAAVLVAALAGAGVWRARGAARSGAGS